jgi:hypothetical protein
MSPGRAWLVLLTVAALAPGLTGCGEKLPRASPERALLYNGTNGESPLRERTLKQGESPNH